jgi:hypothetical protein
MMTRVAKKLLLSLIIGLLTLSWVSAVSSGPGSGQFPGFHASEKGFPGWCKNDQHTNQNDLLGVTLVLEQEQEQEQGYGSEPGFLGAKVGSFPGHRPNGR